MSDLVENPEDRFSQNEAQLSSYRLGGYRKRSKVLTNVDQNKLEFSIIYYRQAFSFINYRQLAIISMKTPFLLIFDPHWSCVLTFSIAEYPV